MVSRRAANELISTLCPCLVSEIGTCREENLLFTFLLSRVAKESEGKVEEKQGDERA